MKVVAFVAVALLVLSNAFWLYQALDVGVARAGREDVLHEQAERCRALAQLAAPRVRGLSVAEATSVLRAIEPDGEPFVKEGALHGTWVSLPLGPNGAVTGIDMTGCGTP